MTFTAQATPLGLAGRALPVRRCRLTSRSPERWAEDAPAPLSLRQRPFGALRRVVRGAGRGHVASGPRPTWPGSRGGTQGPPSSLPLRHPARSLEGSFQEPRLRETARPSQPAEDAAEADSWKTGPHGPQGAQGQLTAGKVPGAGEGGQAGGGCAGGRGRGERRRAQWPEAQGPPYAAGPRGVPGAGCGAGVLRGHSDRRPAAPRAPRGPSRSAGAAAASPLLLEHRGRSPCAWGGGWGWGGVGFSVPSPT